MFEFEDFQGFELRISRSSGSFGETAAAERAEIVRLLMAAAQQVGSGRDLEPLKDTSGHVAGELRFGSDLINGPRKTFDDSQRHRLPNNCST